MRRLPLGLILGISAGLVAVVVLAATGKIRAGALPYLLLLACPLMHLFMGHGHSHGGHSHSDQAGHSTHAGHSGNNDDGAAGQSCHGGTAEKANTKPEQGKL